MNQLFYNIAEKKNLAHETKQKKLRKRFAPATSMHYWIIVHAYVSVNFIAQL